MHVIQPCHSTCLSVLLVALVSTPVSRVILLHTGSVRPFNI